MDLTRMHKIPTRPRPEPEPPAPLDFGEIEIAALRLTTAKPVATLLALLCKKLGRMEAQLCALRSEARNTKKYTYSARYDAAGQPIARDDGE